MAGKGITFTPELGDYLVAHSNPSSELSKRLIEETNTLLGDVAVMQIAEEQGAFLTLLAKMVEPKLAVEVGTFTGYSSIAIAEGMSEDSRLLCCDVSQEFTDVARRYWKEAGIDDRVELVLAPATETLAALPADTVIDFAFIDADKTNYAIYYELILERMPAGGLIVVDNVLWSGSVLDPGTGDDDLEAIKAFNDSVVNDSRVFVSMVNVGDGLTLIRKK